MALLMFGNIPVKADAYSDGAYRLLVVYSTGWTLSTETVALDGFPLSLYTDGKGNYSIAVIRETGATRSASTYNYQGNKYSTANVEGKTAFEVNVDGSDDTVAATTTFRGMPLALNASNNLILTSASVISYDEQVYLYLGGMPIIIRRSGPNWYLVVAEV